jgi:hypothetical protein
MPHYYIYEKSSGEIVQTGFGTQDFIDGFDIQGQAISVGYADLKQQMVEGEELVMKPDTVLSEIKRSEAMAEVRHIREVLLSQSDWTQLPDAPVDQNVWAVYRQELRDVTNQHGFPEFITWPVTPK